MTTNWAGNYAYGAQRLHEPDTISALRDLVAASEKVKVLGTRHSFNDIADTAGDLISLRRFDRVIELNARRRQPTVTVEAGITYGQLSRALHGAGFALPNLASLPHISVAGAVATATHGSGNGNGVLATSVSAMEMITTDGAVRHFSREQDGEAFSGVVVALGGLGVVTKLTLNIEPTFDVRQTVYEHLPLGELAEHFDAIMSSAYSVSLFTDWRSDSINQVWLKQRSAHYKDPASFYGATRATRRLHPIRSAPAENCTEQLGLSGPWHERLPHFRMEFTPSAGDELQSEYLVPRHHGVAALCAVYGMREVIAPLLLISEVRTIAADDLWMSPCYRQPCVAIHFTWKKDWPAVRSVLPAIEAQLAPLGARPHWGKLFTTAPAQLRLLYPEFAGFQKLLETYDADGKFRNAFLDRVFAG